MKSGAGAVEPGRSWVKASRTGFVAEDGEPVTLRGINLGGWLIIEGWIIELNRDLPEEKRIPDERTLWRILERRFGSKGVKRLQHAYHDRWVNGDDFARIKEAGFNFVRVNFWHEWLNHDKKPHVIDRKGWRYLDKAIAWGREQGLWVVLDLHGAPGSQNAWDHSGVVGRNELFKRKQFQHRTVMLWREIAARYKDEPAVLGYNLLNEPNGGTPEQVAELHDGIYRAIREVDTRHLIIMEDGLHGLETMPHPDKYNWGDVAYSVHFYLFDARSDEPHEKFASGEVLRWRRQQMIFGIPLYIGEFNTVNSQWGIDSVRRYVKAFEQWGWAWSPWTYKKIESGKTPSLWGLYRNEQRWRKHIDMYKASKRQILRYFQHMETKNLQLNRRYLQALMDPAAVGGAA